MKDQLDKYLKRNNIIPEEHHGGRRNLSILTAKSVIDLMLNKIKEDKKEAAIITTDLSVAFDTCDNLMLLGKLEHNGIRGKSLSIFETYLIGRKAFVEVQGFNSNLLD